MLIKIQFDFPNINSRGMSLSVPTNPNGTPGFVTILASQAYSVESAAVTMASSVAGQAQSAVSTAVVAAESAVYSIIPKNCSLGVKYFCVGFTDRIDCKGLPLNLSNIIPSSVPTIGQPSALASLDRALLVMNPRSITSSLIMGFCFAAFLICLDVICICFLWACQSGLIPFYSLPQIAAYARMLFSVLCCIPLIVLTAVLYGILSKSKSMDLPREIAVQAGEASTHVLAALACAIFMGIFTIIGWLWHR